MIKNIIIGALALSSVGMVSANVNNNENVKNVLSDEVYCEMNNALSTTDYDSLNVVFYNENGEIIDFNYDNSLGDDYHYVYFSSSENKFIYVDDDGNADCLIRKDNESSPYNTDSSFKSFCDSTLSGESIVDVYNNVLDNLFVAVEIQNLDYRLILSLRSALNLKGTDYEFLDISVINGIMTIDDLGGVSSADGGTDTINLYDFASSSDGNIYVDGSNIHYVVNVSNPIKFSQIISSITAVDETDGDISSSITYETTYPTSDTITSLDIGSYPVSFSVSDSSGNTTNGTFTIDVIDITAPTLTNTSVDVSNTSLVSKDDIITRLGITDNYDSFDNLTISVSGYENYQTNYKKASTYPLTITCTDSSGNSETYSVNIYNADNIQPTFSVKNGSPFNLINGSLNTYLSSNFGISVSYLKSLLVATDETDNDITSSIIIKSDTYTGNEDKASKTPYEVVFSVADRSGNTTNLSVKIYVVDDIAPVVHFGADFYISTSNPITQVELANYLKNLYNVSTEASFVSVNSLYFEGDNSTIADTYACTVSYMSANNEVIETYSFNITTTTTESMQDSGEKQEESPKVDKEKVNAFVRFFKAIGRFFSNIGKSIARFFKKIF